MDTTLEKTRLDALESVIAAGQKTFVEVGDALLEIRDSKLYKERGFKTFDDYCKGRWGWNQIRGNQMITAAKVMHTLPPEVNTIVLNEGQARELAPVEPLQRVKVLETAQASAAEEGRPLTARHISEAAETVAAKRGTPPPKSKKRKVRSKGSAEAVELHMKSAEGTPNTAYLKSLLAGPIPTGEEIFTWIRHRARAMRPYGGIISIATVLQERLRESGRHIAPLAIAQNVAMGFDDPPTNKKAGR